MSSALIIEDTPAMQDCLRLTIQPVVTQIRLAHNVIEAIEMIDEQLPDVILLDVLLTGPDGFTLLNELASYADTSQIPIIIISSLNLQRADLSAYNVVRVFDKASYYPQELTAAVREATRDAE